MQYYGFTIIEKKIRVFVDVRLFFLFKQQDFSQWKFISRLEIQKRNSFFFFHERLFWHLLISTCASKVLKFLLVINWVQHQQNLPFYPGTIIFIAFDVFRTDLTLTTYWWIITLLFYLFCCCRDEYLSFDVFYVIKLILNYKYFI